MAKKDTAKYKKLLLEKREEILKEIHDIAKESMKSQKGAPGEMSERMADTADMASDGYDRELSLNIASGEQEIIYEIDESLKLIKEGKYGKCLSCSKKIPAKRLNAVPYAKYCVQCQSKEEKNKH